jgi:hypothetical protein
MGMIGDRESMLWQRGALFVANASFLTNSVMSQGRRLCHS